MIYIGSDHAGYPIKEQIKALLNKQKLEYTDKGTHSEESCDYPDIAFAVAEPVGASDRSGGADLGILLCGSGIGMSIAANKVNGVRAALATNEYMGAQSREHDGANILVLAARVNTAEEIGKIVEAFLGASLSPEEKYSRRLQKVRDYEDKHIS